MASFTLRDLPRAARNEGACAADAVQHFGNDRCTTMAAGIAFYSAFSLAPMISKPSGRRVTRSPWLIQT